MTTDEAIKELSIVRDWIVRKADAQKRMLNKQEVYLFNALQVAITAMEKSKTKGTDS